MAKVKRKYELTMPSAATLALSGSTAPASLSRSDLESLLRTRKLDHTLNSGVLEAQSLASTGLEPFDACLQGGFPRGQISEIVGRRSSGRLGVVTAAMAAATARGE